MDVNTVLEVRRILNLCEGFQENVELDDETHKKVLVASNIISNCSQFLSKDRVRKLVQACMKSTLQDLYEMHMVLDSYIEQHYKLPNLTYYKQLQSYLIQLGRSSHEECYPLIGESAHLRFYEDKMKDVFLNSFTEGFPTDRFCISEEALTELKRIYYNGDTEEKPFVPSDIFFEHRVEICDTEIYVQKNDVTYEFRVHIFPDYDDDSVDKPDTISWVGMLDVRIPGMCDKGLLFSFGVMPKLNIVVLDEMSVVYGIEENSPEYADIRHHIFESDIATLCTKYLQDWYVIQNLLQDESMQSVLMKSSNVKDRRKRLAGVKLSQISRKIRVHNIQLDDILS